MKWKVETWNEKKARLSEWHTWFAWHPVSVDEGVYVWLKRIERLGRFSRFSNLDYDWHWTYREGE